MLLENLKLINFRNHINSHYNLELENLFIGDNGAGKTSILEAIYILFGLKSFKKQPLSSLINFHNNFFRIEGTINLNNKISDLLCLYNNSKTTKINDENIEDLAEFIYNHPIACYTPDILGLLSKEKSDRRSFLDRFIFYYNKEYIYDIKKYTRLLYQKQVALEKDICDYIYIDIINEKILALSQIIYNKRLEIINNINEKLKEIYNGTDFELENVFVDYSSNIEDVSLFNKEKVLKKVLFGCHRDKIEMVKDNKIIEKFSSNGQKKTFILITLYSLIKIIEENRKFGIIALLDDFEAMLDNKRIDFLKDIFSKGRQVIYTGVSGNNFKYGNVIKVG